MAKYNAARHTIESDDGSITLATLHPSVRADKGFDIADWWCGDNEEMENLQGEIDNLSDDRHQMRGRMESAESQLYKAEDKLSEARARIEELETELADLKEKGVAAA